MKKALTLIAILCMATMLFAGCDSLPFPLPGVSTEPSAPACEHDWEDATCTTPKTCSLCQVTEGEALGHTEEIVAGKAATCTENGLTDGKKCSVCGEIILAQEEISKKGHTEETVGGKAATCTETGLTDGKKCSACGVTTVAQEVITASGHKDEDKNFKCDACETDLCTEHTEEVVAGKAATCTETGLTDGKKCSICGEIILAQDEIPAKGHSEEVVAGKAATCTETGLTDGKKCSVCGEIILAQDEIPAKGHTEEIVAGKAATCTETGLTDGKKCSACGEIILAQDEIPANGHTSKADDGDVTTAVTCEHCDYVFVEAKEAVELTISKLTNGTVVTDKMNYAAGDTVKLTITPANGYSQKLSINGEPLLLGWKTNVYTFVAEEGKSYAITGSFEKIDLGGQKYAENWDYSNIANGHIGIYYPNSNESSWKTFTDKNNSYTVVLKDYSNGAETAANNTEGFIFRIEFTINGKGYQFRVIKQNGVYKFQKTTDGYDTVQFDEAATNAILGDGVEFKAERVTGNMLAFSINGKLVYTYTVEGATAAHEVTKFCMWHSNNQGHYIDLPIKAEKVAVKDSIVSVVKGNWDLTKQNDGIVTILNKTSDGAAIKTVDATYTEASVSVVDYLTDVNELSVQFKFYFDTGKYYEVRLHETNGLNLYRIQNMGASNNLGGTGWTKHYELTAEQITKIRSEGVKFTVKLVDGNAELYVDDVKVATVTLGADYVGKTAQIELCVNGNKTGSDIVIPFEVK